MVLPPTPVLDHFAKHDPQVLPILSKLNLSDWFEERRPGEYYHQLTRNIIYQQLAGAAAGTIYSRFAKLVGEVNQHNVLAVPDEALRDVGLSWGKVKYVKDLASKTLSGEVVLDTLEKLDDEEVIAELTKVKGIGRWTAEMFLMFTLHRENIFSYLDLGLKKGFSKLYGVKDPTRQEVDVVISRWSPYKTYGSIALWEYLDNR